MLNLDRLSSFKKSAIEFLDKQMTKSVQTLDSKIAEFNNKRQIRKGVNQLETTSENASIIDLLCLFAFKYQRSWTAQKQMVIDQNCYSPDDVNYFAKLRFDEIKKYSFFDNNKAKMAFSHISAIKNNGSFEDWKALQAQIVTDILHLLALSNCTAEEIYKECMTFPFLFNVSEDVCLQAYYQQQTEQQNQKAPYYG